MIKKTILVIFFLNIFTLPVVYSEECYKTISYIKEISEAVNNADEETLVVFDVDNVISAPIDLIGRPKARSVRRPLFKEYETKYGKDRVIDIHSSYNLMAKSALVEPEIKDIIIDLQQRKIPSVALTAMGTKKFGKVEDPMKLRVSRLKEKGIIFGFFEAGKRTLWDNEAGYESGVIFSGKHSKGHALEYFLENIAKWKPKHIIFIDDNAAYLNSVNEICIKLGIKFTGFHYLASVFDKDKDLDPEIARLQLKILDEQKIWIPDTEAHKLLNSPTNSLK